MTTVNHVRSARRVFKNEPQLNLLADVIARPDKIAECGQLCGADFEDASLGKLFDKLRLLTDAGYPINDGGALMRAMRKMHDLPDDVKAPEFIGDLIQQGLGHHIAFYANEVRTAGRLRRLAFIGAEMVRRANDGNATPDEITEWARQSFDASAGSAERGVLIHDAARESLELLDETAQRHEQRGATSGVSAIDTMVGALMPGESTVLTARPGNGKTALASQIAMHNAERDRPVLFVSLEMSRIELAQRHLCALAQVDGRRIRAGVVDAEERDALRQAADALEGIPLKVWSPARATLAEIRAIARLENAAKPLSLLVVDYIGLIIPDDYRIPRHEQIARISRGLKQLAKELDVPVLALCQLNRDADGERPRLSHLRDSGSVEQDADIVLALHRENENERESVTLQVLKHRHGDTGELSLRFIPNETRFADSCATEWAP